jgi:hypothetical protein
MGEFFVDLGQTLQNLLIKGKKKQNKGRNTKGQGDDQSSSQ